MATFFDIEVFKEVMKQTNENENPERKRNSDDLQFVMIKIIFYEWKC
jgi:hypothetical protein